MEAALDSADRSKTELAAELVRSCGELRVRVTGSSMLPAIRAGDVLLVRHCRLDEADQGDVVLFIRQRRLFAHRVVWRSRDSLVTQGDALDAFDPRVTAAEFLGRVCAVQRRGRPVRNRSNLTLSRRMTAAILRRSAGAGRLLTRLHGLQRRIGL